jgi:endonuclease III
MLQKLLDSLGQKYSDVLGIDIDSGEEEEIFKWFLASILFGAPITEASVIKTYRCFEKRGVTTPRRIVGTGWNGLVRILDEGSYTRYDFKTADKLLEVMGNLLKDYGGNINSLHAQAEDPDDLEIRLKGLGKGIGDVTVSIFLRELRGIWEKADPRPTPLVILAARNLKIIRARDPSKALLELKEFWRKNRPTKKDFTEFETALLRLGKNFCRKGKCSQCSFHEYCTRHPPFR